MPKTIPPKPGPAGDVQTAVVPPWTAAAPPSHIGGRSEQQDARGLFFDASKGTLLIVVSDGVGGSRSGGEASALAVKSAADQWAYQKGVLPEPRRNLLAMCEAAHQRICELAATGEKRAPAATVVALYIQGNAAHWVHSGDSRLYHFRSGEMVTRTRDHSVVQILVEQGDLDESEMGSHPDQGRLLQSLGTKDYREPVYGTVEVGSNDSFVLCTDGFWECTPVREMVQALGGESRGLLQRLGHAINRAVAANGPEGDNVTAVAVVPSVGLEHRTWFNRWVVAAALLGFGLLTLAAAFVLPKLMSGRSGDLQPADTTGIAQAKNIGVVSAPPPPPANPRPEPVPVPFNTEYGVFYPVVVGGRTIYVAAQEFTTEQWEQAKVAAALEQPENAKKPAAPAEPGTKPVEQPKRPKTNVSPEEVVKFIQWLNNKRKPIERFEGSYWRYELPSAAEWTAAARGPRGAFKSPWNDDIPPPEFGNCPPHGTGALKDVGTSNDLMAQWPVQDIVGNASEIVRLAGQDKKFACVGSAYNTGEPEVKLWHDLEGLAKKLPDLPSRVLMGEKDKRSEAGFRLVLVPDEPASTPAPEVPKVKTPSAPQAPPVPEQPENEKGEKDEGKATGNQPPDSSTVKDP